MHASSSIPGAGGFGGVFVQQQQALVRGGAAGAGAGAFRHSRGKSETSVLTRLGYES
jgi:hypothetical protein